MLFIDVSGTWYPFCFRSWVPYLILTLPAWAHTVIESKIVANAFTCETKAFGPLS